MVAIAIAIVLFKYGFLFESNSSTHHSKAQNFTNYIDSDFGFKIRYVSLKETFDCEGDTEEGSNHNQVCQKKSSDLLQDRYYLKQYDVHYGLDALHNTKLLNFFEFPYPEMEIWIDKKTNDYYFASQHYTNFKPLYEQADDKDYAINIVMNHKQKIHYMAALFFIGDIHTANIGMLNDQMVVIDYDDWVIKKTDHFLDWGYDFLKRYGLSREYLSFTAGDLVEVSHQIETLFADKDKLNKLEASLEELYSFCKGNVSPYQIIYNNAFKITECLKTFKYWKPDHVMTEANLENSCLDPENSIHYNQNDKIHAQEDKFYQNCYDMFEKRFFDNFM